MKLALHKQPRVFHVSLGNETVAIRDLGKVELLENEMVSFRTSSGKECDFIAKKWGFYPTSSVNQRMVKEGFRIALVRGPDNKCFIHVVDTEQMADYEAYLASHQEPPEVICWLDALEEDAIDKMKAIQGGQPPRGNTNRDRGSGPVMKEQ